MMITASQLLAGYPSASVRIQRFLTPLNDSMLEFDIAAASIRIAMYLATVGHETLELKFMEEIASGIKYEGRKDLGNTQPGDGMRFKGRGPIQTTGRANYLRASMALYGDDRLLTKPELLEQPTDGCRASAFFWKSNRLNELADKVDFLGVSGIINCGKATAPPTKINGWASRVAYYNTFKRILNIP